MNCIVSGEELDYLYRRLGHQGQELINIIKSKQLIEVIAEGRVDTYIDALPDNGIGFINNKDIADKLYTHNGNKVKIYLEVINE